MNGDAWTVGRVKFYVTEATQIEGDPRLGAKVEAEGYVDNLGNRIATEVEVKSKMRSYGWVAE